MGSDGYRTQRELLDRQAANTVIREEWGASKDWEEDRALTTILRLTGGGKKEESIDIVRLRKSIYDE